MTMVFDLIFCRANMGVGLLVLTLVQGCAEVEL